MFNAAPPSPFTMCLAKISRFDEKTKMVSDLENWNNFSILMWSSLWGGQFGSNIQGSCIMSPVAEMRGGKYFDYGLRSSRRRISFVP